ncbi:rCG61218 [Rattus norvegicus]|nr:rCG61218 [Rattus norvegicus]
MKLLEVR